MKRVNKSEDYDNITIAANIFQFSLEGIYFCPLNEK